jgi:hypothetical protein
MISITTSVHDTARMTVSASAAQQGQQYLLVGKMIPMATSVGDTARMTVPTLVAQRGRRGRSNYDGHVGERTSDGTTKVAQRGRYKGEMKAIPTTRKG